MRYPTGVGLLSAAVAAGGFTVPVVAQGGAEDYPAKTVTIVVPFAAGASHDRMLRPYMQSIFESSGRRFVLAFKPGAGTTIGTASVAQAAPDGYTIVSASPAFVMTPSVYPSLPYDNVKDFAPISLLSEQAWLLVVPTSTPYKNVPEYIAYARAHPGELNWSSSGKGSATHLPGEFLHYLTKTKVTFVHYKTGPQRLLDLASGRVQVTMASFANVASQIEAGKVRAIAVTTSKRAPDWPDLQTIEEQGVKGYDFSSWLGLFTPARTPPEVINKLNAMFVNAYKDPNVRKIREAGDIFVGASPEEFRRRVVSETGRWQKLVKESGIEMDAK